MPIPSDTISVTWNTFTDEYLTPTEASLLSAEVGEYSELLAKILLDTDFLDRYPAVRKLLEMKAPRVVRCLTNEDPAVLAKTVKMQKQDLQTQLFEKQKGYTEKLSNLVELENEIIYLKKILATY